MKILMMLLIGGLLGLSPALTAQSSQNVETVLQVMKDMQSRYNAHPLSFEVKYTYSNEHTPEHILDSLQGRMELSGARYRYLLGNTETMHNDRYNVVLFKEDKIMYLGKSDTVLQAADPLQPVRTALQNTGITNCDITHNGRQKIVRVSFREGAPYKSMEITMDSVSGHILVMRYVVKTALLMDAQDNTSAGPDYDEYAIVQAVFGHYQDLPADPSRFDEQVFFLREGKEYTVTPAYQDYKIFIGSPNL